MGKYYYKYFKGKGWIPIQRQVQRLEKNFPLGKKRETSSKFSFIFDLSPDPLGKTYKLKLEFVKQAGLVSIYVLEPNPLPLAKDEAKYPHMYSQKEQKLCLYYPKANEFNARTMYWDTTIISWAKEWLFFYETWLITGLWLGEGIEHNK